MKTGAWGIRLARYFLRKVDRKRMRTWPSLAGYRSFIDVDALNDGEFFHQIDVFLADENKRNGETLIDIHGGAYVYGDRKNNYGFASVFLEKGYDVVLLDYDPNNAHHGVEDQVATLAKQLCFLHEHAERFGLNRDRFHLLGDSAGGHFALVLAELASDEELQQELGYPLHGIQIHGCALSCPVFDFERNVNADALTPGGRRYMFGPSYAKEGWAASLSPKTHLSRLRVPFYLCSCQNDFLKQESLDLHEQATALGLPHQFEFLETETKAISHVYNIIEFRKKEAVATNAAIDAFLRSCA